MATSHLQFDVPGGALADQLQPTVGEPPPPAGDGLVGYVANGFVPLSMRLTPTGGVARILRNGSAQERSVQGSRTPAASTTQRTPLLLTDRPLLDRRGSRGCACSVEKS
ncbi:MAG: hypothetical protein M5U01_23830 [Ardenticatenaceae bacterium]|nr:hypothetical protein [Ardenticatenaceae bacterium]